MITRKKEEGLEKRKRIPLGAEDLILLVWLSETIEYKIKVGSAGSSMETNDIAKWLAKFLGKDEGANKKGAGRDPRKVDIS